MQQPKNGLKQVNLVSWKKNLRVTSIRKNKTTWKMRQNELGNIGYETEPTEILKLK